MQASTEQIAHTTHTQRFMKLRKGVQKVATKSSKIQMSELRKTNLERVGGGTTKTGPQEKAKQIKTSGNE
jgi:hypothetical protein